MWQTGVDANHSLTHCTQLVLFGTQFQAFLSPCDCLTNRGLFFFCSFLQTRMENLVSNWNLGTILK